MSAGFVPAPAALPLSSRSCITQNISASLCLVSECRKTTRETLRRREFFCATKLKFTQSTIAPPARHFYIRNESKVDEPPPSYIPDELQDTFRNPEFRRWAACANARRLSKRPFFEEYQIGTWTGQGVMYTSEGFCSNIFDISRTFEFSETDPSIIHITEKTVRIGKEFENKYEYNWTKSHPQHPNSRSYFYKSGSGAWAPIVLQDKGVQTLEMLLYHDKDTRISVKFVIANGDLGMITLIRESRTWPNPVLPVLDEPWRPEEDEVITSREWAAQTTFGGLYEAMNPDYTEMVVSENRKWPGFDRRGTFMPMVGDVTLSLPVEMTLFRDRWIFTVNWRATPTELHQLTLEYGLWGEVVRMFHSNCTATS